MKKSTMKYQELALIFKETKSDRDFTNLYLQIRPSLRSYIVGIVKDGDVAEDILAKTSIKVYQKIDSFDPAYQITTWIWTIAKRECLRWIKKERNVKVSLSYLETVGGEITDAGNLSLDRIVQDEEDAFKQEDDYEVEDQNEINMHAFAVDAIKNLKPLYRDMLSDNLLSHMKYKDIAYKHDEALRDMQASLEALKARTDDTKEIATAQKVYDKYYKKSLQRVKNRVRRGKFLVAEQIKTDFKPVFA